MNNLKITIRKAEGTDRGTGWYFLVNGVKDGRTLSDVGGEDWFFSKRDAQEAAKEFCRNCEFSPVWGWYNPCN